MSEDAEKPRIRNLSGAVLSDDWTALSKYEFDYRRSDGGWDHQDREVYHRGDAAAVLPYDPARGTVLLIRQFRLPVYLKDGEETLIEVCAGVLDEDDAEACVRREAIEELGYRLHALKPAGMIYSSPGSVTERVWCFTARYSPDDNVSEGGGAEDEGEDIEVMEMTLDAALGLVRSNRIMDAKTVLLLQHLKLLIG